MTRPDAAEAETPAPATEPAPEATKESGRNPSAQDQGDKTSESTEDEAKLGAEDESTYRQEAESITNIMKLQAGVAVINSSDYSRPPTTGRIAIDDFRAILAAFCGCDAFRQAEETLERYGMVVLLAGEGTGRYIASLALLDRWPTKALDKAIVSYAPTTSIAELARKDTLKPGGRYLLHDLRGDGRASADQRFDVGRLKQTVVSLPARLVITADPVVVARGDFAELVVNWAPPDGGAVFDQHLACSGRQLKPDDLARARAHAAGLSRPAEVAGFVRRLADGLDAAMHSQADAEREEARDWFEDKSRTLSAELAVAAACFLNLVPERTFERCLARLQELVREYDQDERAPRVADLTLDRSREAWAGNSGLITTIEGKGRFGERLVAFRSPHMRQHVLFEIWNRYGYGLIQPLRDWIDLLVADLSVDVRVQTAAGLALLAEGQWWEVKESFLDRWSTGLFVRRAAAANTLSMMSGSEVLAPVALEVALGWLEHRQGARRAMTAALALGGALSIRYQDKAFEELWHLATKDRRIDLTARVALSVLLSGAAGEPARAISILRTNVSALAWTEGHATGLDRRAAVSAIAAMLSAKGFAAQGLVVAELLRTEPEAPALVGRLFGAVLESAPHYHDSVDVLRRVLLPITETEDGIRVAHELGVAVFGNWSQALQRKLIPMIQADLVRSSEDANIARAVVRSFLHSTDPR